MATRRESTDPYARTLEGELEKVVAQRDALLAAAEAVLADCEYASLPPSVEALRAAVQAAKGGAK